MVACCLLTDLFLLPSQRPGLRDVVQSFGSQVQVVVFDWPDSNMLHIPNRFLI